MTFVTKDKFELDSSESKEVGIRLTQVAPTGCGLALVFGEGG